MSWFFGRSTKNSQTSVFDKYATIHSKPLQIVSLPHLYLAFGGLEETCLFEISQEDQTTGWVVLGTGIMTNNAAHQLMKKNDWHSLLHSERLSIQNLDGHFVGIRWNKEKIELFTDQLGLRTAYYNQSDSGVVFSTRMDWVAQVSGQHEILEAAVGSRWFLFNQLSYDSCIKGVERLGPSASVTVKNGTVMSHQEHPWLPEFGNSNGEDSIHVLESLVHAASMGNRTVALALSGGFDSRTLLALLLAEPKSPFSVFSFGEPEDPDVQISKIISSDLHLRYEYLYDPIPDPHTLFSIAQDFAAQNILVEPVSSIVRLRHYPWLHNNGQLVLDGGLGELARRQYLNRIVRVGRTALRENNITRLFQLVSHHRAEIFTEEYKTALVVATTQSLAQTLNAMPGISDIGVENFVDLLSIRTRVPNFGGPEQARSDAQIVSYMPMVQPSFLRAAMKTDVRYRKNGKLYRKIIQECMPTLSRYPLVKSGTTYPFGLSLPCVWMLTKIKTKLAKPFSDPMPDRFLMQLKNYIFDLVNSNDVKTWEGYDYKRIVQMTESYFRGDTSQGKNLAWWLTFELWKRSLSR